MTFPGIWYYDAERYEKEEVNPFEGLEDGELHTFYFHKQQVIKYGHGVNDLHFFTEIEAVVGGLGILTVGVRVIIPNVPDSVPSISMVFRADAVRAVV